MNRLQSITKNRLLAVSIILILAQIALSNLILESFSNRDILKPLTKLPGLDGPFGLIQARGMLEGVFFLIFVAVIIFSISYKNKSGNKFIASALITFTVAVLIFYQVQRLVYYGGPF